MMTQKLSQALCVLILFCGISVHASLNICPRMPTAAAVTSQWINSISAAGAVTQSQPAFTDISGTATIAQLPGINTFRYLSSSTSVYGGTNTTLSFTTADNTVVGVNAGTALTTSSSDNTLYGFDAGLSISSGVKNVVIASQPSVSFQTTTGSRNVVIGYNTSTGGIGQNDEVIIGNSINQGNNFGTSGDVVIGSTAQGNSSQNAPVTTSAVTIGYGGGNGGAANGGVSVGTWATAGGTGDIILGEGMQSNSTSCFVAGYKSVTTQGGQYVATSAANQISFGSDTNSMKDMYIGQGAVSTATPPAVSIQPTPRSGSNAAGANITITAGNGTGTGGSGSIIFKTAPVAGSSSTANTLANVGGFDASGNLNLYGSTSGQLNIIPTAATTTYTLTMPAAQGGASTTLSNNGSGTLSWAAILSNPMTTGGDIIYGGSSGTPTRLANGSSGQLLQSAGGTSAPTWATLTAPTKTLETSTGTATGAVFLVSGITVAPTAGATYTNNSNTFTVTAIVTGNTILYASCSTCTTSGATLTKTAGTGDATITFSTATNLATYTVPSGVRWLKVTAIGGGGSGGGSAQSGSGSGAGGGGGSGGASIKWVSTTGGSTFYYAVGTGGAAPSTGANDGNSGSRSYWDIIGMYGGGGNGGRGAAATVGVNIFSGTSGQQAAGSAAGGDINMQGAPGMAGIQVATGNYSSGNGGTAPYGGGGGKGVSGGSAGNAGNVPGGGGGGAGSDVSGSNQAGGAGANGEIIIEEFVQ